MNALKEVRPIAESLRIDARPVPEQTPARSGFQPGERRSRCRKLLAAAVVIPVTAAVVALIWSQTSHSDAVSFQLARIERGRIDSTVAATGTCNAVVDVQVGSQVSGNIKTLYADFNTRVKAGQLVALIDPDIFEAKVRQADAAWRNAKAGFENAKAAAVRAEADLSSAHAAEASQVAAIARTKVGMADAKTKLARRVTMFDEQILSREDFDTAQASYDQAVADEQAAEAQHDAAVHNIQSGEAAVDAARKTVAMFQAEIDLNEAALRQASIDLEHTRITAPVDGTVIARRMDVGQTVAASFQAPTIFEIAQDLTKMQVDTNVAESDVGRVRVGQSATFTVDAYPGQTFQGQVAQIRQAPINVQNVITYDVVVAVPNPDFKLLPGMTANVTILIQRSDNELKLPNAALRVKLPVSLVDGLANPGRPNGSAQVYVKTEHSKARPVPVTTGISDGNFTGIQSSNLHEGDMVIVGSGSPGSAASRSTAAAPVRF